MENKIKHSDEDTPRTERVITSNDLLNEANEEREKQGLHEIPAVNSRTLQKNQQNSPRMTR